MDRVPDMALQTLAVIVEASEEVRGVTIEQNTDKETLTITAPNFGVTTMNCSMNSVGATIRQVCKHIAKRDILDYSDRIIGD